MGKIIVADDQVINLELIKMSIQEINLMDLSEFYINGQQVVDRVKQIVNDQLLSAKSFPIRPARALILDFQMPQKNGIEVVKEVKEFYNRIIMENDQMLTRELFLQEPIYIFLSSHVGNTQFVKYCREQGVRHFFEKPISNAKLKSLLCLIEEVEKN